MTKALVIALSLVVALAVPAASEPAPATDAEGCFAMNPAQPKCTYTATADTTGGGAAGSGSWVVTIKLGKKTTTVKSPSDGSPSGKQFTIKKGSVVTATALTAGSGVIVGGW